MVGMELAELDCWEEGLEAFFFLSFFLIFASVARGASGSGASVTLLLLDPENSMLKQKLRYFSIFQK